MKVVSCAVCGILFDLYNARWCDYNARWCDGHPENPMRDRCKVCPMGHALHDLDGWERLPWRPATDEEREHGLDWALMEVPVGLHEFTTQVGTKEEHAEIRDALKGVAERRGGDEAKKKEPWDPSAGGV